MARAVLTKSCHARQLPTIKTLPLVSYHIECSRQGFVDAVNVTSIAQQKAPCANGRTLCCQQRGVVLSTRIDTRTRCRHSPGKSVENPPGWGGFEEAHWGAKDGVGHSLV